MEEIIRCIKEHPILYDNKKTPNSVKKKKESWEEIALDLGQSVEALKKKWAYLRESYHRSLKDKTKKWQWAKEMEFLYPYLKFPNDDKNTTADQDQFSETTDDVDVKASHKKKHKVSSLESRPGTPMSDEDYQKSVHKRVQTPMPKLHKSKHKVDKPEHKEYEPEHELHEPAHNREVSSEITVNGPTPKKPRVINSTLETDASTTPITIPWNSSFDATELLFLGYAKTLKNFAKKNQAVAKMKIAKIIMEQELLQCDQDERRDSFLDGF